jgi:DNA-binding MarR family transcriptional regulator
MANSTGEQAGLVLDRFIETMFRLMMDHHQRHITELELTLPQAQVLKLLREKPMCTGEVAAELGISAPAVTQLTDRLVRKYLIERRAVDGDRRSVQVALTPRGRRAVDRFRERRRSVFNSALESLSSEDQEYVVFALGKVIVALEGWESRAASHRSKASNPSRDRKRSRAARGLQN